MKKEKIIVIWGSYLTWDGGIDFLCYMVSGLNAVKAKYNLKFYLLLPYDSITTFKSIALSFKNALKNGGKVNFKKSYVNEKIRTAFKDYNIPVEIVYYNYLQKSAYTKVKAINADVLFPVIKSFNFDFDIPYISYIPDLQHKHLPHFFTNEEIEFRDNRFKILLKTSKAVIVNAKAVKEDIGQFYNESSQIYNLPFCPPGPFKEWKNLNQTDISSKYYLPNRYFLISNQFWKHKDHITAFRAYNLLLQNEDFKDVILYCTGLLEDNRFPEYVEEIKAFIKQNKLGDKIRLLGYIDKQDQIALMNNAVALIQPTLFEGGPGGGAVYNAVSLGTRCIVSDIPVNKEIEEEIVTFFKAASEEDLCEKMVLLLNQDYTKPSIATLESAGRQRTVQLGESLMNVVNYVSDNND